MKITFDAKELISASEWVIKVSPNGSVIMDISENGVVTFRAEGNPGMRSITLNAHIEDVGEGDKDSYSFSGPHLDKMISALMKKKADGQVVFEFSPHVSETKVSYNGLKFPVALLFSSGVLPVDNERFSPIGSADYDDLIDSLRSANKLTGSLFKNSTQFTATSMIDMTFSAEDSTISIMGTDKTTLGVFFIPFIPDDDYIVDKPSRFLIMPDLNNLKTDSDVVTISESPESMKLDFGGGKIATIRKQQADLLPWDKLMKKIKNPKARQGEVSIRAVIRDIMTSSDIAISLIPASGEAAMKKIIIMKAGHGNLSISAANENSPVDVISTEYEGDEKKVLFNYDELKSALSALSSNEVYLKYADDDSPVVIEPIQQDGSVDDSVFLLINPPYANRKR
jgi:hypothetical protein